MFVTSTEDINKKAAKQFCDAMKKLAEKPENLENLQCYLSRHFDTWLKEYADQPKKIAYELECFSEMEM